MIAEFCDEDIGFADRKLMCGKNAAGGGGFVHHQPNHGVVRTVEQRNRAHRHIALFIEAAEQFEQLTHAIVEKNAEMPHHGRCVAEFRVRGNHAH